MAATDRAVLLDQRPAGPRTWHCAAVPPCDASARTESTKTPWHHCGSPSLAGLFSPLVADDTRQPTRVVPVDREDYVGAELVQTNGVGRPVMALNVERADGSNDRVVYAPTATATADELEEARHG